MSGYKSASEDTELNKDEVRNYSANKLQKKDSKGTEEYSVNSVEQNWAEERTPGVQEGDIDPLSKLNSTSFYRAWLLLCYSTGPVLSMSRTYVPAVIQSVARILGKSKSGHRCSIRGNDCYVKFGAGTVHFTSYVLYLRAIYTSMEGIVSIFLMGIADYSNYRKWFLIGSIAFYGLAATPFYGLTDKTYAVLIGLSVLYCLLNVTSSIYQILENSYIPLFMRAAAIKNGSTVANERRGVMLKRGSKVSVMGMFLGNCGGITALLIGIIITYGKHTSLINGYTNYLLAITIAGCITTVMALTTTAFIPNVKGKEKPKGEFILFLTLKRLIVLLKNIRQYPNAFLYCVAWVIWNVSFSNFSSVFLLLFRSTLGLGSSDAEYTVYSFMSYILASLGSLLWMFLYPYFKLRMKSWGYIFLSVSLFTNFWGCLGISSSTAVGFKHRWEFWLFEVFYSSSSSAFRSLNRALYSTMVPEGEEAQYLGLEVMLGVATGWIGSLVNAVIQDRTNNDRYPFLPNLFLVVASIILYFLCDTEKGMRDVNKLMKEEDERAESSHPHT